MAFNRDNRSGAGPASRNGGHDFRKRSFDGSRGDRQMFKTTCSNCGKECEVPFQPTGSKPVYCSDCFRTMGGSDSRRSDDRGSRRPSFGNGGRGSAQPQYREQFDSLNAKLDKILKLLNPQKPTEEPIAAVDHQVVDATNSKEIVEPVKKKTRSKKLVPTEDTMKALEVNVTPAESDTPTETPTE